MMTSCNFSNAILLLLSQILLLRKIEVFPELLTILHFPSSKRTLDSTLTKRVVKIVKNVKSVKHKKGRPSYLTKYKFQSFDD